MSKFDVVDVINAGRNHGRGRGRIINTLVRRPYGKAPGWAPVPGFVTVEFDGSGHVATVAEEDLIWA